MSIVFIFFYVVLGVAISRLTIRAFLSTYYHFGRVDDGKHYPKISVIVPAYNEELTIGKCLESLLDSDYPDYEVIVVDDGSTDKTLREVRGFESSIVKVIHQPNQGKANALNRGVHLCRGEIVVTVDADTKVHREALRRLASRFGGNARLGAVAGNVKVDPAPGLLTALQAAEYTVGINLIRKAQSVLGCVMVVPGPIAALKREAVEHVGLFTDDTFAEDFDVTMEILKAGYTVEYEGEAVAYTEAPTNLEDLMKQRRRWYRGMIQVLNKHRNMYLRHRYGIVGMVGVPNLWFDSASSLLNMALIFLALLTGFLGASSISLTGLITYFCFEWATGALALTLDPMRSLREFSTLPLLPFYNMFLDGIRTMALTEEMVDIVMEWETPKRRRETYVP